MSCTRAGVEAVLLDLKPPKVAGQELLAQVGQRIVIDERRPPRFMGPALSGLFHFPAVEQVIEPVDARAQRRAPRRKTVDPVGGLP